MAVIPFENMTPAKAQISYERDTGANPDNPRFQYRIDRYSELTRSLLETILSSWDEVTLVERFRVDSVLLEKTKSGRYAGRVDSRQIAQEAGNSGADYIVYGQILDFNNSESVFRGYGIGTTTTSFEAFLKVGVVEVATERNVYLHEFSGWVATFSSKYGTYRESDFHASAIRAAFEELKQDPEFKDGFLARIGQTFAGLRSGATNGLISIEFAPKPVASDVTIDGHYIGTSPLRSSLEKGKEYKISISKEGFRSWSSLIVPLDGLRVTKELLVETNK